MSFPTRALGSTGEHVSMIGLGGSHIGSFEIPDDIAIKIIRTALDAGVNFLDNSWDYNHGRSERLVGKALKGGYRHKAFVMTKLDGRTKESAADQLDESLMRLKVDHIDLLQHHEIIRFDDVDRIFAKGGAMETFVAARKAGKIRYIGFTGHKDPHIHLYMLETAERHNFHFDTVQMPLNLMDAHFRSFEKNVVPVLVKEKIGVLGMKSMGSGVLLKSKIVTAEECLRYALSLPTSVVITGIDSMKILDQALRIAEDFTPLTEKEMTTLRAKTKQAASTGEYELFKTSQHFDSTAKDPSLLGKESKRVKTLTA